MCNLISDACMAARNMELFIALLELEGENLGAFRLENIFVFERKGVEKQHFISLSERLVFLEEKQIQKILWFSEESVSVPSGKLHFISIWKTHIGQSIFFAGCIARIRCQCRAVKALI